MMHETLQKRSIRNAIIFMALSALSVSEIHAQEAKSVRGDQDRKDPVRRVFYGSYTPPAIRSFESRAEKDLESLIKDGKLQLSDADAVRLALENNVDINVERYNPYFSLWGVDKGKGVLNPSILFSSNVNRLVTPSSSVLQGGDTLLNLNTDYDLSIHKPFEPGLDVDVDFRSGRLQSSSTF